MVEMTNSLDSFSPLRYWGSLYPYNVLPGWIIEVLVPFDIGVVYIVIFSDSDVNIKF